MVISKLKIGTYLLAIALIFATGYFIGRKQVTTVTTPPIIGKFEPATPISQKPVGEPLIVTWRTATETIYIKSEGRVNDSLLNIYRDSIGQINNELEREKQRAEMFLDAITFREFEHTFEDDNLKISFSGVTQGYLKGVSVPLYEIKPMEVEVPVKRFGVGLIGGYGIGQDLTLKPYIGLGLSYSLWEF